MRYEPAPRTVETALRERINASAAAVRPWPRAGGCYAPSVPEAEMQRHGSLGCGSVLVELSQAVLAVLGNAARSSPATFDFEDTRVKPTPDPHRVPAG